MNNEKSLQQVEDKKIPQIDPDKEDPGDPWDTIIVNGEEISLAEEEQDKEVPFPLTEKEQRSISGVDEAPWDPAESVDPKLEDQTSEGDRLCYTVINHRAQKKLGLTVIDYCVINSIYHLQNNPKYKGWCVASLPYFASFIGCNEKSVRRAKLKGIEKGLLRVPEHKKNHYDNRIVTTQLWYDSAIVDVNKSPEDVDNNSVNVDNNPENVKRSGHFVQIDPDILSTSKAKDPDILSTNNDIRNKNINNDIESLSLIFLLKKEDIKSHIDRYGSVKVREKLYLMNEENERNEIENPGGWLSDALYHDWKDEYLEDKKRARKEYLEHKKRVREENDEAAQTAADFKAAEERPDIPPEAKAALDRIKNIGGSK